VTKLQTALALSPEQVAALPPPTLRIRQLEQENSKLLRENDELRRQLHMQTRRPSLMTDPHFDMARRGSFHSSVSADYPDRDLKRRRMSQNVDEVYLVNFLFLLHAHVQCASASSITLLNECYRAPARLRVRPRQRRSHVPRTFRHRHCHTAAICPRRAPTRRRTRARASTRPTRCSPRDCRAARSATSCPR